LAARFLFQKNINFIYNINKINKRGLNELMILKNLQIRNLWGLGIGDWGLGIGDWAQSPIPNPQSPIPKINLCGL
jgi:hypothetical protein